MLDNLIKKIHSRTHKADIFYDSSLNVNDHSFIWNIIMQPNFPWLISFPRTGSHWLRMIMELYFEKPSLVEIYYFKDAKEFTCFHQHDTTLTIGGCTNVIYLYRNPVDTVYSVMNYHKNDLNDPKAVRAWAKHYGQHLSKWLIEEKFTRKKTVLTYEDLKKNIHVAFNKVCDHFGYPYQAEKLDNVLREGSKEKAKQKTKHDPQVINLSADYEHKRKQFVEQFSSIIYDSVLSENAALKNYPELSKAK